MEGPTEDLVTAASEGDAGAVDELLVRYLPDLEAYLKRHAGELVRMKESASDLAQSVCREVLERLNDGRFEYQGEAAFRQWMYRAAVMKMLKRHRHWRSDRRDPAREAKPAVRAADESRVQRGAPEVPVDATPSREVIRLEELELFQRCFAELPERYQDVVRLHHAEGRTHAEIAAQLELSEANSRMLLSRALGRLAKLAARSE